MWIAEDLAVQTSASCAQQAVRALWTPTARTEDLVARPEHVVVATTVLKMVTRQMWIVAVDVISVVLEVHAIADRIVPTICSAIHSR